MTKIEKVLRDIQNLRDFYKRTMALRLRIQEKTAAQSPNAKKTGLPESERLYDVPDRD
jgi:hypothetical protein